MIDRDDISAPSEPDPNENPKDVIIRNLTRRIIRLEKQLSDMRTADSWRTNPDRMGS